MQNKMMQRLVIIKKSCRKLKIIRQQKIIQQIQLRKRTNTDSQPEAKKESTSSSTQKQQNNVTATTETKPQNIEKEMLNLQLIKLQQKDASIIRREESTK